MGLCMCDECSPRQSSIGPRWRRIGDGGKNATDADGADTDGINDKELGKDTEQDEMMEARDEDTKQLEVQVEIQPERYCKNTFKNLVPKIHQASLLFLFDSLLFVILLHNPLFSFG